MKYVIKIDCGDDMILDNAYVGDAPDPKTAVKDMYLRGGIGETPIQKIIVTDGNGKETKFNPF